MSDFIRQLAARLAPKVAPRTGLEHHHQVTRQPGRPLPAPRALELEAPPVLPHPPRLDRWERERRARVRSVRVQLDQVVAPPPVLEVVPPPEPPAPAPRLLPTVGRWVSTCRARCASTGLRCKLLDGHDAAHATERGAFVTVLPEGAAPARHIDEAATRRRSLEVP